MTQTLASSASARTRAWIGLVLIAATTATLGAASVLEEPQIAKALSALVHSADAGDSKANRGPILRQTELGGLNGVQPFFLKAVNPAEQDRAVRCLTDALYYEAANEPEQGQRAVAQVVVNRVRDKHFPQSICGVVYEGWERRTGCQFSFVCDGSIHRRHADIAAWDRLRPLAVQALNGYVVPEVGTATHYYATYVRPNWLRSVAQITEIGKHVFCSWKGKAGLPSALDEAYTGGEFKVADAALNGVRAFTQIREVRRRAITTMLMATRRPMRVHAIRSV